MSADGIAHGTGDCIQRCGDAIKGCAAECTCAASGIPCWLITIMAGTASHVYSGTTYSYRWPAQTISVTGISCVWTGYWNAEVSTDGTTWASCGYTASAFLSIVTPTTSWAFCGFVVQFYIYQTGLFGLPIGIGQLVLSGSNLMPGGTYAQFDAGIGIDMGWVVSANPYNCAYVDGMETRYKGPTASGPWTLDYYRGFRGCTSLGCTRSTSSGGIYWESVNGSAWIDIGGPFLATDAYGRLYTSIPGGVAYAPVSYCYVAHDTFSGYVMTVGEITALSWVACDWGCPEPTWTPAADPPCEEGTSPPTPPAPCTVTGTPPDLPPSKHCRTIWKVQWNDEDGGHNRAKPGSWSAYGLVSQICTLAAPTSPIAMTDDAWVGPSGGWYYYSQLHTETCSVNADCTSYGTEPTTYPA